MPVADGQPLVAPTMEISLRIRIKTISSGLTLVLDYFDGWMPASRGQDRLFAILGAHSVSLFVLPATIPGVALRQ